jgi:hypothetical protein
MTLTRRTLFRWFAGLLAGAAAAPVIAKAASPPPDANTIGLGARMIPVTGPPSSWPKKTQIAIAAEEAGRDSPEPFASRRHRIYEEAPTLDGPWTPCEGVEFQRYDSSVPRVRVEPHRYVRVREALDPQVAADAWALYTARNPAPGSLE